jgi:hypothetical protein
MASLAGFAAAAASGMGRQHDGKTGEETSASESRLQGFCPPFRLGEISLSLWFMRLPT